MITMGAFQADRHARSYVPVLDAYPAARDSFLTILNTEDNGLRLIHFQEAGFPALTGITWILESDDDIVLALASLRFRQAVGVGVALRMGELGWRTSGKKGPVTKSQHFGRAELYERRLH
jgi:hypothetical protein